MKIYNEDDRREGRTTMQALMEDDRESQEAEGEAEAEAKISANNASSTSGVSKPGHSKT